MKTLKVTNSKLALENQANELAHLKLKAFRSQLNPHFIFNALNAIQYFITSENKKSAVIYLSVFSKLIRFYLNQIEKETVSLNDEIAMLNGYLKLQKLRYDEQVNYVIERANESKNIEACIPSFLLQTLFENIIEHAIYNQFKNYSIGILFKTNKKFVTVSISFDYEINKEEKVKYIPEYREQLIKWQDQIRLLNQFKNYKIEKKVTFNKNPNLMGGTILLSLPNLCS